MLGVLLLVTASSSVAQGIRWTGSTSYSRGAYIFDATTHTLSLSNGLTVALGPLEVSGTLPLLLQNSQWVSQVGGIPLPTGGAENRVVQGRGAGETVGSRKGTGGAGNPLPTEVTYRDAFAWSVGDPFFSASAELFGGTGALRSIRTQVSAKAPVRGIESGVGTGAWDVGAGGSAFATLAGTFVFVDMAYWWFGDLPDLELRDGITYGVGLSRAILNAKGSLSLSFFGAAPMIESMKRPASIALGLGYSPRLGRSLSGGVSAGLSESSPDFSVYFGWSLTVR
jgi:hypothetical protein